VAPPLSVERNGDSLTLTWPECPPARLEQTENLTLPASWTSTTSQINVAGGQRIVTLSPTENLAFFRLVLE